jgi:hypothetical protein
LDSVTSVAQLVYFLLMISGRYFFKYLCIPFSPSTLPIGMLMEKINQMYDVLPAFVNTQNYGAESLINYQDQYFKFI